MSAYICTDFSGDPSFADMLERSKQLLRDFYRNIANFKYYKQLLDNLILHPEKTAFSDVCYLDDLPIQKYIKWRGGQSAAMTCSMNIPNGSSSARLLLPRR